MPLVTAFHLAEAGRYYADAVGALPRLRDSVPFLAG
jgi:hypothetical protein